MDYGQASVVTLLFIVGLSGSYAALPGINFVGIGYDLIKGNPDGGDLENGGTDPGIKLTMKGLELTYDEEGLKNIPKEVIYEKRVSCSNSTSYEMFTGGKSYQKKFATQVEAGGGGGGMFWDFSFSASAGYEEANQETTQQGNVFFEESVVCNLGAAGYRTDAAKWNDQSVTKDFAASVCHLPDEFSQTAYKNFLSHWGTHLITNVEFGTKYTKRYKMSKKDLFTKAMKGEHASASASVGAFGYSASVSVSVDKFKVEAEESHEFGESFTEVQKGTSRLPAPIKIELTPVFKFIKNAYMRAGCPGRSKYKKISKDRIATLRKNMERALENYPGWIGAQRPYDPNMSIPLTWPIGSYGLPMTASGCPSAKNFEWHEGKSYYGNWNTYGLLGGSHFPADMISRSKNGINTFKYCVKTQNDENALLDWPAGSYCVYKKGPECPPGFASSGLRIDSAWRWKFIRGGNRRQHMDEGTVPEMRFHNPYTDRFVCCRDDGFASNSMYLPTDTPFYLFPPTQECQNVVGMSVKQEWFKWGKWTKLTRADNERLHPTLTFDGKEFYCYYERIAE